jgi:RNA polymerase sigma factor (sigma-70 family)
VGAIAGKINAVNREAHLGSDEHDPWAARPKLVAYARSVGAPADDAEDIVQEAFARLMAAQRANITIDSEEAWLFTTAHRLTIDQWRRRRLFAQVVERLRIRDSARPDVDAPADPDDTVWAAVGQLPRQQRAAIFLRYRGDLDYRTIGQVLNVSESAARSYVTKGLDELEQRIGSA